MNSSRDFQTTITSDDHLTYIIVNKDDNVNSSSHFNNSRRPLSLYNCYLGGECELIT